MKDLVVMLGGSCVVGIGILLVVFIAGIIKKNFELRPNKSLKIIGILAVILFILSGIAAQLFSGEL